MPARYTKKIKRTPIRKFKTKLTEGEVPEEVPEQPLHYNYAQISPRAGAYVIDVVLIALPLGIASSAAYQGGVPNYQYSIPITSVALFLYFFLFTWLNNGQTLGQLLLKIQVLPDSAIGYSGKKKYKKKLTVKQAALHSLGKIVYLIVFDILFGLIFKREEHGDLGEQDPKRILQSVAKTVVVEKNPSAFNK